MTVGFSIFLMAAGAVLRYALSYRMTGIDLHILGLIIMLTGLATLLVNVLRGIQSARRPRPAPIAATLPLPSEHGTNDSSSLRSGYRHNATYFDSVDVGTPSVYGEHPGSLGPADDFVRPADAGHPEQVDYWHHGA